MEASVVVLNAVTVLDDDMVKDCVAGGAIGVGALKDTGIGFGGMGIADAGDVAAAATTAGAGDGRSTLVGSSDGPATALSFFSGEAADSAAEAMRTGGVSASR